jgi:hypothetical protein
VSDDGHFVRLGAAVLQAVPRPAGAQPGLPRKALAPWRQACRIGVKVFVLSFALGVVSGTTRSVRCGANWQGVMQTAGNIASLLCIIFIGACAVLLVMLADTVFSYRVLQGKATALEERIGDEPEPKPEPLLLQCSRLCDSEEKRWIRCPGDVQIAVITVGGARICNDARAAKTRLSCAARRGTLH